jgi:hypothetical protein
VFLSLHEGLSHEVDSLFVYGSLIRQYAAIRVEAKLSPDPSIFACCF